MVATNNLALLRSMMAKGDLLENAILLALETSSFPSLSVVAYPARSSVLFCVGVHSIDIGGRAMVKSKVNW